MTLKKLTLCAFIYIVAQLSIAGSAINDMQSCQGVLEFVQSKLGSAESKYAAVDVKKIRKGLSEYNDYIQREIISPGLLDYSGGDEAKAALMQQQVDLYKGALVESFQARYRENRFFTDYAIAVNNCVKKIVPSGQALENLKEALNLMIKLSKGS